MSDTPLVDMLFSGIGEITEDMMLELQVRCQARWGKTVLAAVAGALIARNTMLAMEKFNKQHEIKQTIYATLAPVIDDIYADV